jgi:hypothetical protein
MRCDEFDQRFQRLLDARANPLSDSDLQEHVESCVACHARLCAWDDLTMAMECREVPSLSDDFSWRVVARLGERQPLPLLRNRYSRLTAVWAVVAVVLICVLPMIGRTWLPGSQRPTVEPVSAQPAAGQPPQVPISEAAVARNQQPTSQEPVAYDGSPQPSVAPTLTSFPWMDGLATTQLAPMNQFADPFRPVAKSFNAAFGALRKTIPIGKEPNKPDNTNSGAAIFNQSKLMC